MRPDSTSLGDSTVSAGDDGVNEGQKGGSWEEDKEGHLVYDIGLVMNQRCTKLLLFLSEFQTSRQLFTSYFKFTVICIASLLVHEKNAATVINPRTRFTI